MHDGKMRKDSTILTGSNMERLPSFADCAFDSCVTDPPYELGFMGKAWDKSGIAYSVELWREVYRVLKPGAYLLAFGGSRTYHRMACAIEDAGFEIRDQIQWIYGSGFPKSLNVAKAIDDGLRIKRDVVGTEIIDVGMQGGSMHSGRQINRVERDKTVATSDDAKTWDGWGTALKPAHEPICMARKPLEKGLTVAQNVLKWGTGAINVDACRVESDRQDTRHGGGKLSPHIQQLNPDAKGYDLPSGRFPANVIHDGSHEVLAGFPQSDSERNPRLPSNVGGGIWGASGGKPVRGDIGDSGSAARFFYSAKASKGDRNAGLDGFEIKRPDERTETGMGTFEQKGVQPQQNAHPTVKPTDLMQYLCRLVTPPGGLILDPFLGSGSTMKAAIIERFRCIGIELNPEYAEIARARLTQLQVKLF